MWSSIGSKVSWCQIQIIWESNDLVVIWFEVQVIWLSLDLRFKKFCLPIDLGFKWFGCRLIWDSSYWLSTNTRFKRFMLSIGLRLKWFGCQLMCDSTDFGCHIVWDSIGLVVIWFGIQMILVLNWFQIQMGAVVNWFAIPAIWLSTDLRFKWLGCQLVWDSNGLKLGSSKTKLFCETSFKNEAWRPKNEAFAQDFLQNWNFEALKSIKNETLKL